MSKEEKTPPLPCGMAWNDLEQQNGDSTMENFCNISRIWNLEELNHPPKTFQVEIPCFNDYGRIEGVNPIWIEGEPFRGKTTRIFAWWGLPKGASATQKVPAMVLVHGGGGTAFAKWVKSWNDRGYAAIALDTNGQLPQGECDGTPHNPHPWSGPMGWQHSVSQVHDPLKDQWTYHAVAAIMRCHSFLRNCPEIDANLVGITGISWGGYLTCITMSVDPRFKLAVPVYGCGWYDLNPFWSCMGTKEEYQQWLAMWDPKHFLIDMDRFGITNNVLFCCGTNDAFYPLDAVKRTTDFVASHTPVSLSVKLRMPHGHNVGDPKEITAIADHVLKKGNPLPRIYSAKVQDGKLHVVFNSGGRQIVRAELLSTKDDNPILEKRLWTAAPVKDFDSQKGEFSIPINDKPIMYFANIITDDDLVISTRIFDSNNSPS